MQISPLNSILTNIGTTNTKSVTSTGDSSFPSIFSDIINNVKETEATALSENEKLLTGESDDIHTAMIASQKAEVAVNLAVQVRDKVINAYNEVMNMQV
jgi:flagellar hook-basal body complex protein FliE